MSKWTTLFNESASVTNETIATKGEPIVTNVTIVTPEEVEALIQELHELNTRWQKACMLDDAGAYLSMPAERLAKIDEELSRISRRATEIWDTLKEQAPDKLEGLELLPWPPEQPEGR